MRECNKKDINWLTAMMLDTAIYDACYEDGMVKRNTRQYVANLINKPGVVILAPVPGKMIHTYVMQNNTMWEIHTAIKSNLELSGKERVAMSRSCAKHMVEKYGVRKFITHVPEGNRSAGIYARMCGLEKVGVLEGALKRGGSFIDLTLYQSSTEDMRELIKEIKGE